ncbi:MAG: CotH kinase family protein [Fibrobacterales bacterium]
MILRRMQSISILLKLGIVSPFLMACDTATEVSQGSDSSSFYSSNVVVDSEFESSLVSVEANTSSDESIVLSASSISSQPASISSESSVDQSGLVSSSVTTETHDDSSDEVHEEGHEESTLLRSENRERENMSGEVLLATDDWRDSTRFVFHPDSLYTYELLIDESDLAFLDIEPQREEYVPASIVFQGDTVDNVLVRYKGSKGAWTPCGEGSKSCNLSTKVKFNTDGNKDRLFYGLKKLQFHSMNHSPSHLAEKFAYWGYRQMGLAASRTAYARLIVNGTLQGLFLVVEQIDGRFTRYHLNDSKGNVYKHYWPLKDSSASTADSLTAHLETNEEEADHTVVTAFENDLIGAGMGKNDLAAVLKKWNMAEMIARQVVTANAVYDWDGPYMGAWDSGHNTYWAVLPETEKIIMIPWDMDMPEFPNYMIGLVTQYTLWNGKGGYPGCPDKTTSLFSKSWFCFPEEYEKAFVDLENKVLNKRDQMLTEWSDQIRPVMEDIAETLKTGTSETYPASTGYPRYAQKIRHWEDAIDRYTEILDEREHDINTMKKSLGL